MILKKGHEMTQSKKITMKEKFIIVMLSAADFLNFCTMSIMAPFYPKEASEKGMTETVSGLVFGCYGFMVVVASPIAGKILPKLGMKMVFTLGLFTLGITNLIFGLLAYVDDYYLFTIFSFLIRGLQGVGTAFYCTASFVIITKMFPENGGLVRGILELFVGLGLAAGPAIGGFLFHLGGFSLPFYVVGAILLIVTPFNKCFIPEVTDAEKSDLDIIEPDKKGSFRKLVKVPYVIMSSANLVVLTITWSCLNPTLEPYLRKYDISVTSVSLVFLLFSIMYLISSPVSGWLSDRITDFWALMVTGLILSGVSMLLLGLSEYIFDGGIFWFDVTCIGLLGVFVGLAIIPTYQGILNGALYHGKFEDTLPTQSLVAGLWSTLYSIGETIGPISGGAIFTNLGFPLMVGGMGGMNMLVGIIGFVYYFKNRPEHKKLEKEYLQASENGGKKKPIPLSTISEVVSFKTEIANSNDHIIQLKHTS